MDQLGLIFESMWCGRYNRFMIKPWSIVALLNLSSSFNIIYKYPNYEPTRKPNTKVESQRSIIKDINNKNKTKQNKTKQKKPQTPKIRNPQCQKIYIHIFVHATKLLHIRDPRYISSLLKTCKISTLNSFLLSPYHKPVIAKTNSF